MLNHQVKFNLLLADEVVGVTCLFESTKEYCRDYLTEEPADKEICIDSRDIAKEREIAVSEYLFEDGKVETFSDGFLEPIAVYRKIAQVLLAYNTIVFHGSVVEVDGWAYMFTAKSGTGKSTHARLWRQYFGTRAVMINDDKPLVKITDKGVWVYGTPWNGKHRIGNNRKAPLRAIAILKRDTQNRIDTVEKKECYGMLIQQMHKPKDPQLLHHSLALLDSLLSQVSIYNLYCNQEETAATLAYERMSSSEKVICYQLEEKE